MSAKGASFPARNEAFVACEKADVSDEPAATVTGLNHRKGKDRLIPMTPHCDRPAVLAFSDVGDLGAHQQEWGAVKVA